MHKIRQAYNGKLLKVFVAKHRLPNGYTATFEIVKHPGAALIVPFLMRDKVIMLRQLRPVINSYIYELPAGTLDKGEAPLSCARREIIEETGFAAKRFTRLAHIYPVPGYSTEKIVIYKAEGLFKVAHHAEVDEIIKWRILKRMDVRSLFRRGKIVDAKTICALAFCGWL